MILMRCKCGQPSCGLPSWVFVADENATPHTFASPPIGPVNVIARDPSAEVRAFIMGEA